MTITNVLTPFSPAPTAGPNANSTLSGFQQIFSMGAAPPTTAPPKVQTPPPPFVASYEQDATVSGPGGVEPLNPMEYATKDTADRLAAMLGGKVVESQLGGQYTNSVPERDIVLPGGKQLNAGLTARLFEQYGADQGSASWKLLDMELGLDSKTVWPAFQGGSGA